MTNLINLIRDFLLSDSQLSQKMEPVELTNGQVLFERGDREANFYLIKNGQIRIYECDLEKIRFAVRDSLDTLKAGQTLGELALIDGQPHSVTAVSLGSSDLLRLNRNDFLKRLHNCPELSQLLIQLGNQRLSCLIDYIKSLEEWIHLVANSQCDRVIEDLEEFDVRGEGLAKSGYLAGILPTVADSFKDIVQTVQQLKGNQCQLEVKLKFNLDDHQDRLEVKLKFDINEHKYKQEVEEIVNAEYFSYLVKLAERKNNTVSDTEKSGESEDKVLPFNKSGVQSNSQVNFLQNPEIKQALIRGLKSRSEIFNRLILKAWEDEKIKRKLLANPREVYAKEFGFKLPDNLGFEVLEETLNTIKIVLPINPFTKIPKEELSDEILDAIAGGNWNVDNKDTLRNFDRE